MFVAKAIKVKLIEEVIADQRKIKLLKLPEWQSLRWPPRPPPPPLDARSAAWPSLRPSGVAAAPCELVARPLLAHDHDEPR
jgi:hypothetical protein